MRSTFRVLFFLKRDKQKANGNVPIFCRITINKQEARFGIKKNINPENWSVQTGRVLGRTKEAIEINSTIDRIKTVLYNIYDTILLSEIDVTAEKVKNHFLGQTNSEHSLLVQFQSHNDDVKKLIGKTKSKATYQKYEVTRRRLEKFIKEKYNLSDIPFKEINHQFITDFEVFLLSSCNCKSNTAAKFIQLFKRIVIIAKNNGWITKDPFANYKIRIEKVDRGYLTQQEIYIIMEKKLSTYRLDRVRDIFIFCCFTGLAYIDVKSLRKANIRTGFDNRLWIMGKREKTGVTFNIPLLDISKRILDKYEGTLPDDKLLPVLSNQKMNAYLKEIGDVCGIEKELTFHLARHTFATFTLTKGVSIESVSKMLGHTNINTTQIYARVIDQKVSQDMVLFAESLESLDVKSRSRLDLLFERMSLREKLSLFNLPLSLTIDPDRPKRVAMIWYNLSESEKSIIWENKFKDEMSEVEKSLLWDDSLGKQDKIEKQLAV